MAEPDALQARLARARAVREGVGLVVTSLVVGGLFLGPLWMILLATVPQIALLMPEPARQAAVLLDGLPGLDDRPARGGEGEGEDLAEEGEEATTDAIEAPPSQPSEPPADAAGRTAAQPPALDPSPEAPPEPVAATREEPGQASPDAAGTGTTPPSTPSPRKGKRGGCGEPHPDVRQIGDGTYVVRRTLVDHYTSSVENFNSLGYSRKYDEERVKGWQVGGFGCLSPLWKGGLRSQDVIRSINGKKTYNVVQLFGIWLGQRNRDEFVVELLRKGQPLTLRYRIE